MKISPQGYVKSDIRQSPANSREQAVTHHLLAAFCVQNNRKWRRASDHIEGKADGGSCAGREEPGRCIFALFRGKIGGTTGCLN